MLELKSFTSYALVALFVTAAWAPILIDGLYRMNLVAQHKLMKNKMNAEFIKNHAHKSGTPNMGGLMISVTVGILAVVLIPASDLRDIFLIGWGAYTLYGLIEGLLVFGKKIGDERFRVFQESFSWRLGKLGILYLITLVVLSIATSQLGIISLHLAGEWSISLSVLVLPVVAFAGTLAIYGMEISDGLDGLATGMFLIGLMVYTVIAWLTGYTELMPLLGLIIGSSLVYLYFNISPARVFMGETGTMPIAFTLLLSALLTNTAGAFVVMGAVFWAELFSSMVQILSIRFLGKKVFKIAPIHHHFEAIGWSETKVVQRFWLFSGIAGLIALWVVAFS